MTDMTETIARIKRLATERNFITVLADQLESALIDTRRELEETKEALQAMRQSWQSAEARADEANEMHRDQIDMQIAANMDAAAMRGALEQAQAAIWDSHYGNGIDVGYARSVDTEIRGALATDAGKKAADVIKAARKWATTEGPAHDEAAELVGALYALDGQDEANG